MSARIRVLIADDQVLFAETLSYVLARVSPHIVVAGIASDGEEAVRMATTDPVDLILMDVRMPRMDGVQATMRIHAARPDVKIVMLTTFDDDEYVHSAIKHGAVGYLLKSIRPQDLVLSIQAVMAGATLFTREIGARFGSPPGPGAPGAPAAGGAAQAGGSGAAAPSGAGAPAPAGRRAAAAPEGLARIIASVSRRELEVLGLVMEMLSNKQIAGRLQLSEQSIRNYMSGLYGVFGVRGRLELMQVLKPVWPPQGPLPAAGPPPGEPGAPPA